MKTKFNEELLTSLLKFDFLVLDDGLSKKTNRYTLKTVKLSGSSNHSSLAILEPGEAIKSLKQLVRLFSFLSKKKKSNAIYSCKKLFFN